MKKGGFLRNVLDTIRPNQQQQQFAGSGGGSALDCGGQLRPQHFALGLVARHGFPAEPSAFAYDPIQRIAAIGTQSGSLRVFGRPGVDAWAEHKPECAVTHLRFIINQGALITVTADDGLHLWSLRGSQLKLQFSTSGSSSNGPTPSPIPLQQQQQQQLSKQQSSADSDYQAYDHRSFSPLSSIDNNNNNNYNYNHENNSQQLQILQTLKFKREHITCLHQTLMSKWLFVGTDRGNVHVVNVETFQLSGYSIAWNRAIELTRKTHPGAIIHLSECPQDTNKLLIGYQSGCIALWDLKGRTAACRYYHSDNLLSLSWLHDGKQFVAAHSNGSLITWLARSGANTKPVQVFYPHAKTATGQAKSAVDSDIQQQQQQQMMISAPTITSEIYEPITKVEWRCTRNNETLLLFSGGLLRDSRESIDKLNSSSTLESAQFNLGKSSNYPTIRPTSLTVMMGKSITVLELDKQILDFLIICENSPHENEPSEPSAAFVLLEDELTIIDLQTSGYPTFRHPYPVKKLAESPVTCIRYLADCNPDLVTLLCSASMETDLNDSTSINNPKQQIINSSNLRAFSGRDWPIAGGDLANNSKLLPPNNNNNNTNNNSRENYPEFVITGHADGSIKFWNMVGLNFDLLAQVRCENLFERPQWPSLETTDENDEDENKKKATEELPIEFPFSINCLEFHCPTETVGNNSPARLLVAGALGQVIQLKLTDKKQVGGMTQSGSEPVVLVIEQTAPSNSNGCNQLHNQQPKQQHMKVRRHMVLKVKKMTKQQASCNVSSSGGSSFSSAASVPSASSAALANRSHTVPASGQPTRAAVSAHNKFSGFQPELICLSPLVAKLATTNADSNNQKQAPNCGYRSPPKVTALVYEAAHSILAYAHEDGVVLVDIIQKSVIISASLADLYGGASLMGHGDVSIQPFATSSILQQHYQDQQATAANSGASLPLSSSSSSTTTTTSAAAASTSASACPPPGNNQLPPPPTSRPSSSRQPHNSSYNTSGTPNNISINNGPPTAAAATTQAIDNGRPKASQGAGIKLTGRSGDSITLTTNNTNKPCNGSADSRQQQQQSQFVSGAIARQPKSAASFQRQLSTTALKSDHQTINIQTDRDSSAGPGFRQFQRQMTASQLPLSHHDSPISSATKQSRAANLLQSARANNNNTQTLGLDPTLASSMSCLGTGSGGGGGTGMTNLTKSGVGRRGQPEVGQGAAEGEPQKTPAKTKGKRIISRMLSISTIHSSLGSASDQTSGSSCDIVTSTNAPSTKNLASLDQASDKIDSSLARSRSSSCSSDPTSPRAANQEQQPQLSGGETILCLCFLDWTRTAGAEQQQPVAHGLPAAQPPSNNNKSLGSIDCSTQPCQLALWLGTSQGSVLLLNLAMPDNDDNRILQLQSVDAEPIPQATIKLQGPIKCLAAFTSEPVRAQYSGRQPPSPPLVHSASGSLEAFEVPTSNCGSYNETSGQRGKSPAIQPPSRPKSAQPPLSASSVAATSAPEQARPSTSPTFLAIVSERQARVYQMPMISGDQFMYNSESIGKLLASSSSSKSSALNCLAKLDFASSQPVKCASLMQMSQPNESCLAIQMANNNNNNNNNNGQLQVHSLPQLRLLIETQLDPLPAHASVVFGCRNGHALYQPSPNEIAKFTLSAQYKAMAAKSPSHLYVAREMPEQPRSNFFKSLLGSVGTSLISKQCDRDELFGGESSCSGKLPASQAASVRAMAGKTGLDRLRAATTGGLASEMRIAREALNERGEKLSEIEDRTLQMMNQSETYSQTSHQLVQKFKDKKWYQL